VRSRWLHFAVTSSVHEFENVTRQPVVAGVGGVGGVEGASPYSLSWCLAPSAACQPPACSRVLTQAEVNASICRFALPRVSVCQLSCLQSCSLARVPCSSGELKGAHHGWKIQALKEYVPGECDKIYSHQSNILSSSRGIRADWYPSGLCCPPYARSPVHSQAREQTPLAARHLVSKRAPFVFLGTPSRSNPQKLSSREQLLQHLPKWHTHPRLGGQESG
jgi:hypothetical protein